MHASSRLQKNNNDRVRIRPHSFFRSPPTLPSFLPSFLPPKRSLSLTEIANEEAPSLAECLLRLRVGGVWGGRDRG